MTDIATAYADTVLHFASPENFTIDLRAPVGREARDSLRRAGLAGEFSIATACNPRGVVITAAENSRRQRELESGLTKPFVRVDACSPDRSHCEPSVAFEGSLDDALALARYWEQIAIFWWDGEKFSIHGALADTEPVLLPAYLK